jgi:epoxyqueuosine reductase
MIASVGQDPSRGLISNYAWGIDYHNLMVPRLEELSDFVNAELGTPAGCGSRYRVYVDTGPVLERAYAARAGLGFIGKNTCLIHPQKGSWLFLGEILTDAELDPTPGEIDVSCGTCRECLDACPTKALIAPYVLDARRCISYLTIELRGPIPVELRPLIKNRVYGCDVCQTVCPWQRFARPTEVDAFWAAETDRAAPALVDVLAMSEKAFRHHYEGTPVLRIGRSGLLRNAAIALGNCGDEQATGALECGLVDPEPLVRGHAAWALGRIGGRDIESILEDILQREKDPYVLREIGMAIEMARHGAVD